MLTRRELVQRGAFGVSMLCLPSELRTTSVTSETTAAATDLLPFQLPLRIPPVLKPVSHKGADVYAVTMRKAKQEVIKGKQTDIWGYDGMWPGPTIKARRNRPIVVRFTNEIEEPGVGNPEGKAVHLHGGNVPADSDGHPTHGKIVPGASKVFDYPNAQFAATHWYHDHIHMQTARNIYMGLSGFYLIEDPHENKLGLPRGEFDVPLMIQDRKFDPNGAILFNNRDIVPAGDVMIVNGTQQPFFEVARRKYRFRIVNASAAREFEFDLSSGQQFVQIGNDGGLLPAPISVSPLALTQAERADVVIDFSQYPVGTQVTLRNVANGGVPLDVMRFDVVREAEDKGSTIPATLRPVPELRREDAVATRDFVLSFNPLEREWQINNQPFEPERPDVFPRLGTTEIWRIRNDTPAVVAHSFHMHLVRFQVLTRNGDPGLVTAGEKGLKDTVSVGGGETVEIIARFGDYPGRYVFHCHNLLHEDNAMMATMEVN